MFLCTLTKIFLGGFLVVAGGFWPLVAIEGSGGGMCQIWSGEIWCREILAPVFEIEWKFLVQNTRLACTTSIDGDKWSLFPMDLSLVAIISWRLLGSRLGCLLLLQT